MEDGQTLFDYNVGLNDIVQLLIRAQTDTADSPDVKNCMGDCRPESNNITASVSPVAMKTNKDNNCDVKPDTSDRSRKYQKWSQVVKPSTGRGTT